MASSGTPSKPDILTHISSLYEGLLTGAQDAWSDIQVKARDRVWWMHRIVLAQSPVLDALLGRWAHTPGVTIPELSVDDLLDGTYITVDSFMAAIGFLYGVHPKCGFTNVDLLHAANFLGLQKLLSTCTAAIGHQLNIMNVVSILVQIAPLALGPPCSSLVLACTEFMARNIKQVLLVTPAKDLHAFTELPGSYICALLSSDTLFASEFERYEIVRNLALCCGDPDLIKKLVMDPDMYPSVDVYTAAVTNIAHGIETTFDVAQRIAFISNDEDCTKLARSGASWATWCKLTPKSAEMLETIALRLCLLNEDQLAFIAVDNMVSRAWIKRAGDINSKWKSSPRSMGLNIPNIRIPVTIPGFSREFQSTIPALRPEQPTQLLMSSAPHFYAGSLWVVDIRVVYYDEEDNEYLAAYVRRQKPDKNQPNIPFIDSRSVVPATFSIRLCANGTDPRSSAVCGASTRTKQFGLVNDQSWGWERMIDIPTLVSKNWLGPAGELNFIITIHLQ